MRMKRGILTLSVGIASLLSLPFATGTLLNFLHPLWDNPTPTLEMKSSVEKQPQESVQKQDNPELNMFAAVSSDANATNPAVGDDENILTNKKIRIINLGPVVNWKNVDYAPTISADGKTLYFVSSRPGSKKTPKGDDSHDFWAVKKLNNYDSTFFKPYNIDTTSTYGDLGVNTSLNEGAASISADQQSIYFTGCNRKDGLGDCDIYVADLEGEKWGRPRNLGRKVNSEAWDSQPSIAPDKSRVYFSSNRPGCVGGDGDFDIWYSDYDFQLEEWKQAVNAGPTINTSGREFAPYIGADNQTMFFSSDGHKPNLGGLDFYMTVRDEKNNWSKPVNLGAPINTSADDQFISLPASGDIIYFSSRRTDFPGYQGDLDVFMAYVPSFYRKTIVKGVVLDECSEENIPASLTIYNPVTKKTIYDTINTGNHKEFEFLTLNPDFGDIKDSVKFINYEVTATNTTYGSVKQIVKVPKPPKVKNQEESETAINLPQVVLKLGQRPVLTAEMAIADWVAKNPSDPKAKGFKGLVMEEIITYSLYPLLNYVFFDEGKSILPSRYILFTSADQTKNFTDERIPGGTLDKYYNVLNIYGYRLTKNPTAKIKLVGCNDEGKMGSSSEKRSGLSKERAEFVYNYFKNIWHIATERMELTSRPGLPEHPSNVKDSMGIVENRRTEMLCTDWEVTKPIFDKDPTLFPSPDEMLFTMKNGIFDDIISKRRIEVTRGGKWKTLTNLGITDKSFKWDWKNDADEYPKDEVSFQAKFVVTSKTGKECESDPITIKVMQIKTKNRKIEKDSIGKADVPKTLEKYNLILFPFDKFEAGPMNEKILKEYVYTRVFGSSEIKITGHTDVVGLYDHNAKLSQNRSKTVETGVKTTSKGNYKTLESSGVGEDEPLYTNALPEGRFYNRTVQIIIRTPLIDAEKSDGK